MKLEDKKKKLSDTHGIPMSVDMDEGVTDMCNLSSGIEARSEARGEARGEEKEATRNILKLLKKNKNIQEIVDLLDYSMEKVTKVAKDNGFVTT